MNEVLQAQLAVLGDEIRSAAVPSGCKQTLAWCFAKLPALYGKFYQTNESRYGEEITRLVQAMLSELNKGDKVSAAARRLAANITEQLRLLHQQLGLAGLGLKSAESAPARARKAV